MRAVFIDRMLLYGKIFSVNETQGDIKMKKEMKAKKHILCEKAPLLAILLGCIIALLFVSIPGLLGLPEIAEHLLESAAAVLFLIAFKRWFSPEFKGVFQASVPAREILMVSLPFIFKFVMSYISNLLDYGFYFNPTLLGLAMAIAAGFYEETVFRGVAVPIGMRYLKNKNKILIIVILTSLIFGLIHIGNVFQGASITMAVLQGTVTIFGGFLYVAAYLRTGSILVPIFMHGIYDYMCFLTDASLDNGIMTAETVTTGLILSAVVYVIAGIWGIYLIRPAVRDKIEAIWNDKWSLV